MNNVNNSNKNYIKISFLVSISLHLVVLVIFAIINLESSPVSRARYSIIEFPKVSPKIEPRIQKNRKQLKLPVREKSIEKTKVPEPLVAVDTVTVIEKRDTLKTDSAQQMNNGQYLKFAQTLLDTFLIRNPQYASMVLKQQAKALANKKFERDSLINRINDELHEYIRKNFPEGSEHELNPYTGPGLQIPIDDLINLVKKLFK